MEPTKGTEMHLMLEQFLPDLFVHFVFLHLCFL